jgi:hypothetical protein
MQHESILLGHICTLYLCTLLTLIILISATIARTMELQALCTCPIETGAGPGQCKPYVRIENNAEFHNLYS